MSETLDYKTLINGEIERISKLPEGYYPQDLFMEDILIDDITVVINEYIKPKFCGYCQSIKRPVEIYSNHNQEDCQNLKRMRCNRCANFGHTSGHCPERETKTSLITFTCINCWRDGKPLHICNSHVTEKCYSNYTPKKYTSNNYRQNVNDRGNNTLGDHISAQISKSIAHNLAKNTKMLAKLSLKK